MNSRIKALRKSLDLTQQAFADRIGSTQNNIASYETGRRVPSASAINNICKTFGVSEVWLRDGIGEMKLAQPSAALDALAMERGLSSSDYIFIEKYLNMKKADRKAIVDFILEVSAAVSQMDSEDVWESATPDYLSTSPLTPEEIDRRTAEYRSNLEMDAEIQRRRGSQTIHPISATKTESAQDADATSAQLADLQRRVEAIEQDDADRKNQTGRGGGAHGDVG